ncbi:MAG TPA: hypothetical protein VHS59_10520, partial [Bacillota bacterium]|nr:hypothetical protein [Bacillota bacterium]
RRIRLGVRNWQLWGSTIFHAGLTIILLATLITGSYRIFCSIKLVEGEAKEIPYQALLTYRTTGFDASDRFQIILQDQQTKLTQTGMEPQVYSTIKVTAPGFPTVQTGLTDSAQLPYRDIYFLPNKYGYAVQLAVEDTTGKVLTRKTIPLDTVEFPNGQQGFQKQGLSLDPFPEHLNLSFMPNLEHPQLSISVQGVGVTALGGNGLTQSFSPGQHLDFGGYRLTFEQVKPWTELLTGYDPGAKLFFVGIALALAGQSIVWLNKFKGEMA